MAAADDDGAGHRVGFAHPLAVAVNDENKLRLSWKPVCLFVGISAGLWVVLIVVAELFIRWAGR